MSLLHFPFVNILTNVSESATNFRSSSFFILCWKVLIVLIPLIHLIVLNPLIAPYTKDKKQILIFKQVGAKPPKCPQGLGKSGRYAAFFLVFDICKGGKVKNG